ncbi:MAG: bifunctional hydroxymethylpyrimidine kinase/phosphomethylpyrimidine kinase [Acidobacteriota bacterium]
MAENRFDTPRAIPVALTIAGSDSGGGAGIQADLKTFAALGVYGTSVVTALTAQNTREVRSWIPVNAKFIGEQIAAVVDDIPINAAKTGMLPTGAAIRAVAKAVDRFQIRPLVVDPVIVATSGDQLMDDGAWADLAFELLPLADLVTPNVREAELLTSIHIHDVEDLEPVAEGIRSLGARAVLIKGGHFRGNRAWVTDWLFDGNGCTELRAPRIVTRNTHGTGCTLSAAVTAFLAQGKPLVEACRLAKEYVTGALQHSLRIGSGPGPLGHFWRYWDGGEE